MLKTRILDFTPMPFSIYFQVEYKAFANSAIQLTPRSRIKYAFKLLFLNQHTHFTHLIIAHSNH
jgi:hypothetical protein